MPPCRSGDRSRRATDTCLTSTRKRLLRAWLRAARRLRHRARIDIGQEAPLRAQLLSAEQMERHGTRAGARAPRAATSPRRTGCWRGSATTRRLLDQACTLLTDAVQAKRRLTPAGEWLLDNYLPDRGTDRHRAPASAEGLQPRTAAARARAPPTGLPRVYDLAMQRDRAWRRPHRRREPEPLRRRLPDGDAAQARRAVGDPDHAAAGADREPAPDRRRA